MQTQQHAVAALNSEQQANLDTAGSVADVQDQPLLFTLDNIFLDVARKFKDNLFLQENNIKPGTQNTALDAEMKMVAKKILMMKDGEYGSEELCATPGGCAMNTCRAANMYFLGLDEQKYKNKVITLGSIGQDSQGEFIQKKLKEEKIINYLHVDEEAMTGSCAVTVVDADRTCIAVLDACEKYPKEHLAGVLSRPEIDSCQVFYSTAFFI